MTGKKRGRLTLSLLVIGLLFLYSATALPSFFEQSSSGNELDELEAMLSGEHRGAAYTSSQSAQASLQQSQTTTAMDSLYAPPYNDVFLNNTFFGDFVRQWRGDAEAATNLSWYQIYLNGNLYLAGSIQQPDGSERHIKPILIEEPDF
jgi:hypothetical protein